MLYKGLTVAALSAIAMGKTIKIDAGEDGLVFTPASSKAAVGDVLEFHFYPNRHSVAMGDFKKACSPASGGFYSGFMPTTMGANPNVFRVDVKNTDPIFFYCTSGSHCIDGMVGVINPTSDMTLDMYKNSAVNAAEVVAPASVGGGVIAKAGSPVSGGSMSSAAASTTAMTSMPASETMSMSMAETTSAAMTMSSGMATGSMSMATESMSMATETMASGTGSMSMPAQSGSGTAAPSSKPTDSAAGSVQAAIGGVAALAMGLTALLVL